MSEYSPIYCLAESRVDSGKDFFEAGVFWLVSPSLIAVALSTNSSLSIACGRFFVVD